MGLDWSGCVKEEQTVTSRQQFCDALRSIPEVQVRRSMHILQCVYFHYCVFVLRGILTLIFALAEILSTLRNLF